MNDQEHSEDRLFITTLTSTELTPEQVEAEAKRFALRTAGILMMAMAERGISEEQLAHMLQCPPRQLRNQLSGQSWRGYLPLAALCLAVGIRLDLKAAPK